MRARVDAEIIELNNSTQLNSMYHFTETAFRWRLPQTTYNKIVTSTVLVSTTIQIRISFPKSVQCRLSIWSWMNRLILVSSDNRVLYSIF